MLRFLMLSCCILQLSALEVEGKDVEYLDLSIRPDWRLTSIADVHEEISNRIKVPFGESSALMSNSEQAVVMSARSNVTIRQCLKLLEKHYGLYYVAKKLHLSVETKEEYLDRQRKVVQINTADYLVFGNDAALIDAPAGDLISSPFGGGSASLFSDFERQEELQESAEMSSFEILNDILETSSQQDSFGNMLYVRATTDEAGLIKDSLRKIYGIHVNNRSYRISMGSLPRDAVVLGGQVTADRFEQLRKQLMNPEVFECVAYNNQVVNAGNVQEGSYMYDFDMVTGSGGLGALDPQVRVMVNGKSVQLRFLDGSSYSKLNIKTQWAEPIEKTAMGYNQLKRLYPGVISAEEGSVDVESASVVNGLSGFLNLHKRWLWATHEQIFYQGDLRYVLHAMQGDKRAVVLVEEIK